MNLETALKALTALSQETRLRVFRLLIEYGYGGAPAGALSEQLGIAHNTLSFHLAHLSEAGLVTSRRQGRSIIYAANCDAMKSLLAYLWDNCCIRDKSGESAACTPECKPKIL
jgi:DNA-binding transcriptional ArsR family regulator